MGHPPSQRALDVRISEQGHDRTAAIEAAQASGLPGLFGQSAPGYFDVASRAVLLLEHIVNAADEGMAAAHALEGLILSEVHQPGSFASAELDTKQRAFVSVFQIVVTADALSRRANEISPLPEVEGTLETDGLEQMLESSGGPTALCQKVLRLLRAYVALRVEQTTGQTAVDDLCAATCAFMELLSRSAKQWANRGALRPLVESLKGRSVVVAGRRYDGLELEVTRDLASGLLPVTTEQIVGNDEYLAAGLRLARDVAGYDFERRRNPKRFNPILFGLGRPGSGKTVTAHAVGNAFLEYCHDRDVPCRFVVVRRTDWASSYQNASALNLVRIFEEEVYQFEGVCGVYWPDIDTAFASRANDNLRMEEKQNLGAAFGVFDGTLLPRDGKWFMICDANTLHMDKAAVSRITQNPFTVAGPTSEDEYIALMRDVLLAELGAFLPSEMGSWRQLAKMARDLELSGRDVDSICRNVRAQIQDFEFPMRYFKASAAERDKIVAELSRPVTFEQMESIVDTWAGFQRQTERQAHQDRFEADVQEMVRRLNAGREAAQRTVSGEQLDED